MRTITPRTIKKIACFTTEFTKGAFVNYGVGGDLGNGARYNAGSGKIWLGKSGGRTLYAAYMIGFALGWARESRQAIPAEMVSLMQETQLNYAKRYASDAKDTELDGMAMAESRWADRYTADVTNPSGESFKAVYVARSMYSYPAGGPVVEVFDLSHRFNKYGQFVTRVDASEVVKWEPGAGWIMHGGVLKWQLTAPSMQVIRRMVETINEQGW